MLRWLTERYRAHQATRERERELGRSAERASRGHLPSLLDLIDAYLTSDDPELRKALSFQTVPRIRQEVARVWMDCRDPRLGSILQEWRFLPEEPPGLRFAVAVLLNLPFQGEPEVYLPYLLAEPRSWRWVDQGLWRDRLFELAMLGKLPEQLRLRIPGLPEEGTQRAVYLLLFDRLDEWQQLDEDGSLVLEAYEQAGAVVRNRLLARLRQLGHTELALRMTSRKRLERQDMSQVEWRSHFELLKTGGKHQELWQLVGRLPPVWAAEVLGHLREVAYQPTESQPFHELLEALPPDLLLTPQQVFSHEGVPLVWLGPRELLLTGPRLCRVDVKEVHQVSLPRGSKGSTWRLSPDAARMAMMANDQHGSHRNFGIRPVGMASGRTTPLAFSPDSQWLAAQEGQVLRLFPTQEGKQDQPAWELELTGHNELHFLSSSELLVLGTSQTSLIDVERGERLWSVPFYAGQTRVRSNREDRLLFFGNSREMLVVDRSTGQRLGNPTACEQVMDAVLGPGGTVLSAGLTRWQVLDVDSGEPVLEHRGPHACVRFAPDGFRLARSRGKQLDLVDTYEGSCTGRISLPGPVTEADFSPDGLLLAVGVGNRRTHVLAVPPSGSVRVFTPDALQELEHLSSTSSAWRFLYALARYRMRHELTLEDWVLHSDDAYQIEVSD